MYLLQFFINVSAKKNLLWFLIYDLKGGETWLRRDMAVDNRKFIASIHGWAREFYLRVF